MSKKPSIKDAEVTVNVTSTKTTKKELVLTGDLIVSLLAPLGVPQDARVVFDVPGGGDWSNTSLDVDEDNPVYVRWKEESEHDENERITLRELKP